MNKPFQFSMRRMLGTVALFGLTVLLAVLFLAARLDRPVAYPVVLFVGSFAAGGATLGCVAENPFKGAYVGALLGIITSCTAIPFIR